MLVRAGQSLASLSLFVLLLLSFVPRSAATTATPAIEVDVRAREVAPGEPLRILVRSSARLSRVTGKFLGADLHFAPLPPSGSAGESVWLAWAAIDLDRKPGEETIDVSGTREDGAHVAGSRSVTIGKKTFPEQRLEVDDRYVRPKAAARERIERERRRLASVYAVRSDLHPPLAPFARPVPGDASSPYGSRRVFNGEPKAPHSGLDLRAATGDPVHAAGAGVVRLASGLYYSGNTVVLDHGAGLFTIYAHLSKILVKEGQSVDAGRTLGLAGATGRVTGPHLHWGAKIGDRPFDPTALLDPALFR